MNDTSTLSLKHMTLVKIAATLWNQEIGAFMDRMKDYHHWCGTKWKSVVVGRVIGKVLQLPQLGPLENEILDFVKPTGLYILRWMVYHKGTLSDGYLKKNLNKLSWTPKGTVDNKKTAKVLIKDENLDIVSRYNLACVYCLEDYILELWDKMPENCRTCFYIEDILETNHPAYSLHCGDIQVLIPQLVVIWTYDINGEIGKFDHILKRTVPSMSPYQYAFESAVCHGNKTATEYFWQKLTSREKEESLVVLAEYVANESNKGDANGWYLGDVLYFLLSQMDEEQKIEIFKKSPYGVVTCYLFWHEQGLIMETANHIWDFLSGFLYERLLIKIVYMVIYGYNDYDYQGLFTEFWQQSPNTLKRYVVDHCVSHESELLSYLFEINDEKNIKLILKDANLTEKKKFIFHPGGTAIWRILIYGDKWNLLKILIQECISSKNEMLEFKEHMALCSNKELSKWKDKWDKFFQLFDNFICRYNKRKTVDDGNNSPAKGLRSLEEFE